MKKVTFENTLFLTSAPSVDRLPETRLPEMAIVGRSNVGKSTLLNHLTRSKSLAKVSSKPGKTQLLNAFSIDDKIFLVDLPGYGYAKVSKQITNRWGEMIDGYLTERTSLKLLLVLLDIRRLPSEDDLLFLRWSAHHKKKLIIVFTKTDKLSASEVQKQVKKNLAIIDNECDVILYSVKDAKCRNLLQKAIEHELSQ